MGGSSSSEEIWQCCHCNKSGSLTMNYMPVDRRKRPHASNSCSKKKCSHRWCQGCDNLTMRPWQCCRCSKRGSVQINRVKERPCTASQGGKKCCHTYCHGCATMKRHVWQCCHCSGRGHTHVNPGALDSCGGPFSRRGKCSHFRCDKCKTLLDKPKS